MPTILKTKNSVTTTVVPTTLVQGELAVNITDKKMWVGNAASSPVQILGAGTTGTAAGSNTQVQYNSSGSLAGSANLTFDGTNLSTTGTVGIGDFAANSTAGATVRFIGNLTSADITGVSVSISAPATASNSTNGVYSSLRTTATSGSRGSLSCFYAEQPSIGAGSSVSASNGVFVRNQGNASIAAAYGIRIEPQSGSTINLGLYNESSARFDGNIGLNTLPSGSGTGITFPATQSASSNANTLDDYEEGDWTPVVVSQTGSLTSYTSSATYTKVGRTVYIVARFTIVTAGTAGGYAIVSGYPFTSASSFDSNGVAREGNSSGDIYCGLLPPAVTQGFIIGLTGNSPINWTAGRGYFWNFSYNV